MHMAKQYGPLIGRCLIAFIFLFSGVQKVLGFDGTVGYVASKGLPLASLLVAISIVVEIAGSLMIILGWRARLGALAIFLWLIPVTLLMHNFWSAPPEAAQMETIQFMKNLGYIGAMLYIMAFGSGPYSLKRD